MDRVIALIPAKLTSQRLPQKNIIPLGGVPLFVHSVRVARRCKFISDIYVSTESKIVAKLAEKENCTIIMRPDSLSDPSVPNSRVLEHALKSINHEGLRGPDYIVVLQPTHPFRNPNEIDKSIMTIIREPSATSLITVASVNKVIGSLKNQWWSEPGLLGPDRKNDVEAKYMNRGSYFIIKNSDTFSGSDIYGTRVIVHKLERPEIDVDIDTIWDYNIAVSVLENNPEIADYLIGFES